MCSSAHQLTEGSGSEDSAEPEDDFDSYDLKYFLWKHAVSRKDATRILHLHRNDRNASFLGTAMPPEAISAQ